MSSSAPSIRLLTLNARQGFGALRRGRALLPLREVLRSTAADLVFLQEIGVAAGSDAAAATQYETLADRVWPQHAYGRNAVVTGGHHGNALLSKFPISSSRNVDVSVGRAEPRGMLHCVVSVPGWEADLHAVCVHLALHESHRRRQVDRLLDLVRREIPAGAPLVIAGDFNDWRLRAHRKLSLEPGLDEVHCGRDGRLARTFPARCPLLRLDRIYVRNLRHRPLGLPRRPWSVLSDHRPLAAEVTPTA
jgi:endonuclease/exonuclease/phosphatase family metal-dependent hydrolase